MKHKATKNSLLIIAITLVAAGAGCGVKPDDNDALPALTIAEREAKLKAFRPWRALGSISIDSAAQGKFNASFAWNVDESGFDIRLFGPLGVQAFHLIQTSSGAELTDRSGSVDGPNAKQLLQVALGTEVPVGKMQDWAVGLPGDSTQITRDETGRIKSMAVVGSGASGWAVDYKRYTVFESMYLPQRVVLDGDGVEITLLFKKWSRATSKDNGRLSIPGVSS